MNTRRLAAGWLLASAVALAFSWNAVAQVRNRVIAPAVEIPTTVTIAAAPATTPPTVIRLELEEPRATIDQTSTTTSVSPPTTLGEAPPPRRTTTTLPATTTTTTATTEPPTSTTTTTTTTPVTTTTTTTTTTPPAQTTSSYTLIGGVVTISHSPGTVNFVAAIPQPGFSTEQRETGPDEVRIRFEGDTHTSEFRAKWEHGELEITTEEGDDD